MDRYTGHYFATSLLAQKSSLFLGKLQYRLTEGRAQAKQDMPVRGNQERA